MNKFEELKQLFEKLNLPKDLFNDRSVLTLLVLLNLKEDIPWEEAERNLLGIQEIIEKIKASYNVDYATGSRESIRRETINLFIEHSIIEKNPDEPTRAPRSPKTNYGVTKDFLNLMKSFGKTEWDKKLVNFKDKIVSEFNQSEQGYVNFQTDSAILIELGEKLVTNSSIALAELVKNSYDADATKAIIRMRGISKKGGTIIIEDDGTGMNYSAFIDGWMRIASRIKKEEPYSILYSRKTSGEKGIGRFACRKLARKLELETVSQNVHGVKEKLTAYFNWEAFEEGTSVDAIDIYYKKEVTSEDTPTYTIITLKDVKDSWNEQSISQMQKELLELITPKTFEEEIKHNKETENEEVYDPGFEVSFDIPEYPKQETFLTDDFFKNAWAKISGCINEKGDANLKLEVIKPYLNKFKKSHKVSKRFEFIKNVDFIFYIFVLNPEFFRNSEWNRRKTGTLLKIKGGIKVYGDKFRIFGYGIEGDDWLKIDADRAKSRSGVNKELKIYREKGDRPGLRLFTNNVLYGHVKFVLNDNMGLNIASDRERLIENESYDELKYFVRLGIDFATVLYSKEVDEKIQLEEEKEEAERKAQEEAKRKAQEETERKAQDLLDQATKIRNEAKDLGKKTTLKRRKIEDERRMLEITKQKLEEVKASDNEIKQVVTSISRLLKEERIAIQEEEKAQEVAQKLINDADTLQKQSYEYKFQLEKERKEDVEREKEIIEEIFRREYALLRALASTGNSILLFQHEMRILNDTIRDLVINYKQMLNMIQPLEKHIYLMSLDSYLQRAEIIGVFAEVLGLAVGSRSIHEVDEWLILPIVKAIVNPFRYEFDRRGIELIISIDKRLRVPQKMYRAELFSIIYNLVSNAYKFVHQEQIQKIMIKAFEGEHGLHIQVLDTGKGLEKSRWEDVFKAFVTDSDPNTIFGTGMGLGLKIVKDIALAYNGNAQFVDPPENWKTCVDILFPYNSNREGNMNEI